MLSPSFTFWSSDIAFHQTLFFRTCFTSTPLFPTSTLALRARTYPYVSTISPKESAMSLFISVYVYAKSILMGGCLNNFLTFAMLDDFLTCKGFLK